MKRYLTFYVHAELDADGTRAAEQAFSDYERYLARMGDHPSKNAWKFASAPWHYDPEDSRSPKYGSLLKLTISEFEVEKNSSPRLQMVIRIRSYSGRRIFTLNYEDVRSYELLDPNLSRIALDTARTNHGQLLIDEFEFRADATVAHFLVWNNEARWTVVCKDVVITWTMSE